MSDDPDVKTALELANKIKPMLAGHHQLEQGAALAELVGTFLAGHAPEEWAEVLVLHMETALELAKATRNEMAAEAKNGH